MFTTELWQFFGVVVVPLIGLLIGGVVYGLKKLDDRLFHIAVNSVTRTDLVESLRPINERVTRLESRVHASPPQPPRWRNS
jgi:hypothetical protein